MSNPIIPSHHLISTRPSRPLDITMKLLAPFIIIIFAAGITSASNKGFPTKEIAIKTELDRACTPNLPAEHLDTDAVADKLEPLTESALAPIAHRHPAAIPDLHTPIYVSSGHDHIDCKARLEDMKK